MDNKLSKYIAIIAIFLWFISLWNVALVSYSSDNIRGIDIILLGWILIFEGNFGWFTNLTLLLILFSLIFSSEKLISIKKINVTMFFTIVFTISAISLNIYYPTSASSAPSPLYGYGLGFIFWFLSIILTFISVVRKNFELSINKNISKFLEYAGWFSLIFIMIYFFYCHINDNKYANSAEKERLKVAFFKKGQICSLEPKVKHANSFGIIEVIQPIASNDIEGRKAIYMFNSPLVLLSWGIPTVRIEGMDYSLKKSPNETLLTAHKAIGKAKFQFIISKDKENFHTVIKEIEFKNGKIRERILSDQQWKIEFKTKTNEEYCPEFKINSNIEQNPRKMIMQALNLKTIETNLPYSVNSKEIEARFFNKSNLSKNKKLNKSCPDNIYIDYKYLKMSNGIANKIGIRPIYFKGSYFFPVHHIFDSVNEIICDQNSIYTYRKRGYTSLGNGATNEISFILKKRSINNFNIQWSKTIIYRGKYFSKGAEFLFAYEKDKKIYIELYDFYLRQIITIVA
jgi:hypothetical protein